MLQMKTVAERFRDELRGIGVVSMNLATIGQSDFHRRKVSGFRRAFVVRMKLEQTDEFFRTRDAPVLEVAQRPRAIADHAARGDVQFVELLPCIDLTGKRHSAFTVPTLRRSIASSPLTAPRGPWAPRISSRRCLRADASR